MIVQSQFLLAPPLQVSLFIHFCFFLSSLFHQTTWLMDITFILIDEKIEKDAVAMTTYWFENEYAIRLSW